MASVPLSALVEFVVVVAIMVGIVKVWPRQGGPFSRL